jgi:hypothetical protein
MKKCSDPGSNIPDPQHWIVVSSSFKGDGFGRGLGTSTTIFSKGCRGTAKQKQIETM